MSNLESTTTRHTPEISDALVVESRFASRRALISQLSESAVAANVIEAKSVLDGYRQLQTRSIDACILGPALSRDVAAEFVSQARFESKNRGCAFIAVVEPGSHSLHGLRAAGIDGTITTPYAPGSFSQVCRAATEVARRRARRAHAVVWADAVVKPNETFITRLQSPELQPITLEQSLLRISDSLREISDRVSRGELKLQRNGHPSLATADAIRLAIEGGFPIDSTVRETGTFDNQFVGLFVQWLDALVDKPFVCATEELRRALVTQSPDRQEVSRRWNS